MRGGLVGQIAGEKGRYWGRWVTGLLFEYDDVFNPGLLNLDLSIAFICSIEWYW